MVEGLAQSVCGYHRNQQVTPIFLNKAHQPVSVRTRVSVQSRFYGMSNEVRFSVSDPTNPPSFYK